MKHRLSIVVFTRNDRAHLEVGLPPLSERDDVELIVFDNASWDGTAEFSRGLPATVLRSEVETSFSKGNNAGLAAARGDLVLFLNPDAYPTGALLDAATSAMADRSIVLLGPRLQYADRTAQPNGWALPSPGQLLRERLGAAREVPPGDGLTDVGWLMGCFLLGRRQHLVDLGGFDERFWFHGTDLELCARAGRTGRVVRLEAPALTHVGHRDWDAARRLASREATVRWLLRDHGRLAAGLVDAAARLLP